MAVRPNSVGPSLRIDHLDPWRSRHSLPLRGLITPPHCRPDATSHMTPVHSPGSRDATATNAKGQDALHRAGDHPAECWLATHLADLGIHRSAPQYSHQDYAAGARRHRAFGAAHRNSGVGGDGVAGRSCARRGCDRGRAHRRGDPLQPLAPSVSAIEGAQRTRADCRSEITAGTVGQQSSPRWGTDGSNPSPSSPPAESRANHRFRCGKQISRAPSGPLGAVQVGALRTALSQHARRHPQHLQPPTPPRLTRHAADLPSRGGQPVAQRGPSSVTVCSAWYFSHLKPLIWQYPRSPSYGELGALGARDATHATSAKPGIASVARELGEGSILW